MATKQVSVRIAAEGGKQVKAELVDIGREGSRSFDQLDRSAGTTRAGVQNLGFQVQDFAVQVAGGTDASRALAQQLPQLLSGFGLFGVLLGTASAILIPFASYLFGASEEALSLEDSIKKLDAAMGDLEGATKSASAPVDQLLDKYGQYADQAQRISDVNRQIAYLDAASALTATAGALTSMFGQLERVNLEGAKTPEWLREVEAQFGTLNPNSVAAVADALSITTDQAILLTEQMVALSEAQGPEAQVAALQNVIEQLEIATGGAYEMDEGTRAVYQSLLDALSAATQLAAIDMVSGVSIAADEAARLANNLFAARQQQIAADGLVYSGRGGDPRTSNGEGRGKFKYDGPALDASNTPIVRAGRGGGGGGGGANKERVDAEREAARVFESTRTSAEKYAIELDRLNELQSAGLITSDTYGRALDDLKKKTGKNTDALKALKDSAGEAFTSFVTGAKSASEAASDLLASLAQTLANSAFNSIAGSLFGGDGGFISNLFGGGKAGGGRVQGGMSYLVGESGPEMITMAGNGYVTPNNALRGGGSGGGVSINIDARGAVEGTDALIARRIQQAMPEIQRRAVSATNAARARGH